MIRCPYCKSSNPFIVKDVTVSYLIALTVDDELVDTHEELDCNTEGLFTGCCGYMVTNDVAKKVLRGEVV